MIDVPIHCHISNHHNIGNVANIGNTADIANTPIAKKKSHFRGQIDTDINYVQPLSPLIVFRF